MKGRNPSSLQKRVENSEEDETTSTSFERRKERSKREKRLPNVKYSERTGKPIEYSGGQVSKQSLKRIKEATETTAREKNEETARKAEERKSFKTRKKAVPQIVTDRMLSRVVRFSGIPMVLGFTTGPTYYYFAKINTQEWLEPWMFFASTATFGLAFVGITYGVLSASWDPSREGSALGVDEFKMNIPILFQTILGKSDREYTASEFDVDGEGDDTIEKPPPFLFTLGRPSSISILLRRSTRVLLCNQFLVRFTHPALDLLRATIFTVSFISRFLTLRPR